MNIASGGYQFLASGHWVSFSPRNGFDMGAHEIIQCKHLATFSEDEHFAFLSTISKYSSKYLPQKLETRVRRHFRFEAYFRLFRIDAKHKNLKRNENGMKRRQNEKDAKNCNYFRFEAKGSKTEAKTAIIFASKRNEAKQKRKNAIIFASKRNGSKMFSLRCEKSVFIASFRI